MWTMKIVTEIETFKCQILMSYRFNSKPNFCIKGKEVNKKFVQNAVIWKTC